MGCGPSVGQNGLIHYPLLQQYRSSILLQTSSSDPRLTSSATHTNNLQNTNKASRIYSKVTTCQLFPSFQTKLKSFNQSTALVPCQSPLCLLEVSFEFMGNKITYGTCALISPIFALTTACNVYSLQAKKGAKCRVIFYNKQQTKIAVRRVMVPQEYMQGSAHQNYALLMLEEPVIKHGFFGLAVLPSSFKIDELFLSSLCMDEVEFGSERYTMKMKGRRGMLNALDFSRALGTNCLSWHGGASGAPVLVQDDKLSYIVGVQIRKDEATDDWYCCLMTPRRIQRMQKWAREMVGREEEEEILKKTDFTELELMQMD